MTVKLPTTKAWAAAISGLLVISGAVGALAASGGSSFDWNAATATATAYGTLVLAVVTWSLAMSTRQLVADTADDARGTRELAQLAAREQEERIVPFVLLWESPEWRASGDGRHQGLPLRNAGNGVALNVNVQVYWHSGNCALAPTSLAAGDEVVLPARSRIEDIEDAWGLATYSDLVGRAWETRFAIERGPDGQIQMILCAYGQRDLLLQQAHPAGWERPNGLARIALPEA